MRTYRHFFLTLDPAKLGLRNALRGTLSVVVSFIACSQLHPLLGFLAGLLAMITSLVVSDLTQNEQKKTYFLIIPIALASLIPSILLSPHHEWQLGVFLLFTFMAIYLRKYGIRWIALGIISFMAYFSPLFFPLKIEMLPLVFVTTVFSVSFTYLLKFIVMPDRPEKTFTIYLNAFNQQYAHILELKAQGKPYTLKKLNELTLIIEGFSSSGGSLSIKSRAEALQMALFEREMSLLFDDNAEFRPVTLDELSTKVVVSELSGQTPLNPKGLGQSTKMAIQATIATGAASLLGVLISPQRWYWASMTAFVVFVGSSRGETLLRASFRVLGTIAGLAVGIMIHPMIAGHKTLEWNLIILSIFCGMYGMRFALGFWSASVFTFMLTILFDVMGLLTNSILLIRFEETLLGALIGAIVSAFVLPTSTKKVTKKALATVLRSQVNVLNFLPLNKEDKEAKKNLVRSIRQMDRDFANLKMVSAPFIGKITLMKRGEMPSLIHNVTAFGHYLRHLATHKGSQLIDVEQRIQQLKLSTLKAAENLESDEEHITDIAPHLKEILSIYRP